MSSWPTAGFRPETVVAIEAVAAGMRVAAEYAVDHQVSAKEGRDVVTTADVAVETIIRSRLAPLGLHSVGEERGGTAPRDGSAYWLIDPICGTRNYASGIPLYCLNVALIEADEVAVAVVGDPSAKEVVVAERGGGAWVLGPATKQSITVSDASKVIIVEEGKSTGRRRATAASFTGRVIGADRWDLRSLGSTLSLAYVARGRVSAYACFAVTAIHGSAGVLLTTEAGGTVSDIDGGQWCLDSDSIIAAATASLHEQVLGLMAMNPG